MMIPYHFYSILMLVENINYDKRNDKTLHIEELIIM